MSAPTPSPRRAAMLGAVEDGTAWKAIVELYFHDKVEEAHDLALRTGAGEAGAYLSWFRMIEAEAVSRKGSEVRRLAPFLEIEYLPDETPGGIGRYVPTILEACGWVSRSLGFAHGPRTRIAFLSEATNAPWATSPYGYCTDMFPYEKLCLPSNLFREPRELLNAVAHEYAHVATLNISKGRATRWLEEAVSMQFEEGEDEETLEAFVSGDAAWLRAHELNLAFGSEDEGEVWDAYEQSLWIGRFLRSTGGDASLPRLLCVLGEDRMISGIWARVIGRTADEHGLRSVFGRGASDTFDRALAWLRRGKPGDPGPFSRCE